MNVFGHILIVCYFALVLFATTHFCFIFLCCHVAPFTVFHPRLRITGLLHFHYYLFYSAVPAISRVFFQIQNAGLFVAKCSRVFYAFFFVFVAPHP